MKLWEALVLRQPAIDAEYSAIGVYRHFLKEYGLKPAELDALDVRTVNTILEIDIAQKKMKEIEQAGNSHG